jgi:hypothetical protein
LHGLNLSRELLQHLISIARYRLDFTGWETGLDTEQPKLRSFGPV